jgi:hypothetical protein
MDPRFGSFVSFAGAVLKFLGLVSLSYAFGGGLLVSDCLEISLVPPPGAEVYAGGPSSISDVRSGIEEVYAWGRLCEPASFSLFVLLREGKVVEFLAG